MYIESLIVSTLCMFYNLISIWVLASNTILSLGKNLVDVDGAASLLFPMILGQMTLFNCFINDYSSDVAQLYQQVPVS